MATNFSPPPTYADVVLHDKEGKHPRFNPIWLKWFVDLAGLIGNAGGGSGSAFAHNSLSGLQGGTSSEYYHLTSTEYTNMGIRAPTSIINSTSTAGSPQVVVGLPADEQGLKSSASGILTADVLSTVLNLTGSGVFTFVSCQSVDATARTHRFKLTIDGVVVYDSETASTGSTGKGIILIGTLASAAYPGLSLVPFNTSFKLEYASDLTETDKTRYHYQYWMTS